MENEYLNKPVDLFYKDGKKYWENIEPTNNGVLGGLGYLNDVDIQESEKLLRDKIIPRLQTKIGQTQPNIAGDCGGGIGRITKNLLLKYFNCVDVIESDPKFLNKAIEQCKELNNDDAKYILKGLEDFEPEVGRYKVLWCQWVLSHLTDEDVCKFISRALESLRPVNGILVLKENEGKYYEYIMDEVDSSVTRSKKVWEKLIVKAGGKLILRQEQKGFPKNLFKVGMYVIE